MRALRRSLLVIIDYRSRLLCAIRLYCLWALGYGVFRFSFNGWQFLGLFRWLIIDIWLNGIFFLLEAIFPRENLIILNNDGRLLFLNINDRILLFRRIYLVWLSWNLFRRIMMKRSRVCWPLSIMFILWEFKLILIISFIYSYCLKKFIKFKVLWYYIDIILLYSFLYNRMPK